MQVKQNIFHLFATSWASLVNGCAGVMRELRLPFPALTTDEFRLSS
jgi:hypothetical protein